MNTKRELLKNEIEKLQNEALRTNREHDELLNNYNSLVSRGFFKVAEQSYSARILRNEEYKKLFSKRLMRIIQNILRRAVRDLEVIIF